MNGNSPCATSLPMQRNAVAWRVACCADGRRVMVVGDGGDVWRCPSSIGRKRKNRVAGEAQRAQSQSAGAQVRQVRVSDALLLLRAGALSSDDVDGCKIQSAPLTDSRRVPFFPH